MGNHLSIWSKRLLWLLVLPLVLLPVYFFRLEKEIRFFKRHALSYKRFVDSAFLIPRAELGQMPQELNNVPFGESTGLVLGVKTIKIRGVHNPYNASIATREGGYRLFFRYDEIDENVKGGLRAYIGMVELDEHLQQTDKEYVAIDTHSDHAEDPRVLQSHDQTLLVYNDFISSPVQDMRVMCTAKVDLKNDTLQHITQSNPQLQPIEKNWVPFEYQDEQGQTSFFFEYSLDPRKIVQVDPKQGNNLVHLPFAYSRVIQNLLWPKVWGSMRGGTPAQRVGNQYLAFFHSSFFDHNEIQWYCMGAYTFEAKPPFRFTGISHYPILFDGIYGTPPMNTAAATKRVIFPCGFVITKHEGKEVILLSCGENDSSVKVVMLDKEELFKNLNKVKLKV